MDRQILRLAIPNVISNITIPLLGMVDLAILGHLESETYIGAIAIGGLIFSFIYAIFSFLRMGTSGFTAQSYGENNKSEMILIFGRSMFFAIVGGLVLIALQYPIGQFSFYLIDGSEEVEVLAREYYNIRLIAAPASLGILALSGWFVGMQNARTPMLIAIAINLINIAANMVFVYVFGMKSSGVAWGTVIAQYFGLIFGLSMFWAKHKDMFRFWNNRLFFNWKILGRFFRVNIDIIIRTLCLIFTFAFFTSQSAKIDDTMLAVNTVLLQYLLFFSYLTDGFAYAAEALVGKFIGSNSLSNLKSLIRKLFIWGFGMSIPFSIVYLFFGRSLLMLLTDNERVIESASPYLFWIGLVPLATFAAFIWDGIYIGATSSVAMRNTLLIATFFIFLPSYYLLRDPLGNHGLWFSLILFMMTRGLLLTFFRKRYIYSLIKV